MFLFLVLHGFEKQLLSQILNHTEALLQIDYSKLKLIYYIHVLLFKQELLFIPHGLVSEKRFLIHGKPLSHDLLKLLKVNHIASY